MDNNTLVKGFIHLPVEQRKVFFEKLSAKGICFNQLPIPSTKNDFKNIPLSYAQQRQWVLWQLDPESSAYHMNSALRMTGPLNIEALQSSFNWLLNRHEVLRTHFVEEAGELSQIIEEHVPFQLVVEPLNHKNGVPHTQALETELKVLGQKPFDLNRGSLLRVKLIHLSEQEYVLALVQHHIVSDAWSMQLMVGELVEAYRAFSQSQRPSLPELPIQYADYAIWQRCWMEAGERERQLTYWKKQLGTEQSVLSLPIDHSRPMAPSYIGANLNVELDSSLCSRLQQLASCHGVTLHMLLLASFQTLLYRYSGQDDVRVGVPIANRTRLETENLIGFFVNTQVLRADFSGDITFSDLLRQVKQSTVDAQAHQDLSFEHLVDVLQPERSLSYSPLFQVVFNYLSRQGAEASTSLDMLGSLKMESLEWDAQTAQFDLSLEVSESEDGLFACFNYATDLFEKTSIERMAKHWQNLLHVIVVDSTTQIHSLAMLSQEEQQDWVHTLNPHLHVAATQLVQQQFEDRVRTQPGSVALVLDGLEVTYDELNKRANRLAYKLIERGVGPDVLVGVAVERSIEMIVGVLAILKAGGAYVPLDPAYPEERLVYMVQDSGLALLLTQASVDTGLPLSPDIERVYLEGDCQGYDDTNPSLVIHDKHLAYMIFTSGTTGLPKGVGIDQGSLARHAEVYSERLALNADDCVLQYATLNFDTFGEQVFPSLYSGATIVIRGEELWDHDTFYNKLIRYGVSVANLTPSMWYQLFKDFSSKGIKEFGRLRQMVVGGEAMPPGALSMWQELGITKQTQLWNFYGPTEATAASSSYCCNPLFENDEPFPNSVPIGQALKERRIYIVDHELNLVPPGVAGEIVIGGDLLARGYHGRASLTSERFIVDPFDQTVGGRLYRTGDLASYRSDGVIEYLGRIDHQVKIRGFRIELGEIEAHLQSLAELRDAAVIAQEGKGSLQLVAYLIPSNIASADTDMEVQSSFLGEVKQQLEPLLPKYMIPAQMVLLDEFPLTPNGKLDRNALPILDASAFQREYKAPESELEKQISAIWQEVLGIEQIGLNDNFFELGGHSLLLTQVISRVRHELAIELPLRTLFEASNLGGFADRVAQAEALDAAQLQAITKRSRDHALPLSYAQQRQWILWELDPESAAYHMPAALRLRGNLNIAALQKSFDWLFTRHEVLRTHFVEEQGQLRQVISPPTPFKLVAEPLIVGGDQSAELALQVELSQLGSQLFDLSKGPLIRIKLFRISEQEHTLALVQHHIVSDDWSVQLMIAELVEAYQAFSQGKQPSLPELPIQYADFAVWQRERLEGEEGERQLNYWKMQLGTEHPVLELPTDHPRPMQPSYVGDNYNIELDILLTGEIRALAQRQGVTLHMLLLASFQTLLHRYSGQDDIRVGVPIANRNRLEAEQLIGFFVNTQVLKANFNDGITFEDLLQQVKQTTVDAQAHQDLPFERLVEVLQPERSLTHSPLFQVMFNYLSEEGMQSNLMLADLNELHIEDLTWEMPTAQFDLSLDVSLSKGRLIASFNYSTELFEVDTIVRMASHWLNLLQAVVVDGAQRIENLAMLKDEETDRLLHDWNHLEIPVSDMSEADKFVHQRIADQAHLTSDAIALVFEEKTLSYAELEQRVDLVAWHIQGLGAKPGARVGIATQRNIDMVVGLLAILKCGAAYVPLDPQYPDDRLAYMMIDSGLQCILTQSSRLKLLPVPDDVAIVLLDGLLLNDVDMSSEQARAFPPVSVHPESLAYVIYTSGSTGKPKGVSMSHRALRDHIHVAIDYFELTPKDHVLLFSSLNFDGFIEQLFPALCVGAGVVIRGDEVWDSETFYQQARDTGLTVADLSTAYWHMLVQELAQRAQRERPDYGNLRQISATGEAMPPQGIAAWQKAGLESIRLLNTYGPTETTVTASYMDCKDYISSDKALPTSMPIGRGLAGRAMYILDSSLQPVPVGVVGELYIGGSLLAEGYHCRPALTAERFIVDPFSQETGVRMYATGDLAYYRADGTIEYVGRTDFQVKIRGFRIELGEIESHLQAVNEVRDVVVIAQEFSNSLQLVAYVVPQDKTLLNETESGAQGDVEAQATFCLKIKAQLESELPEYMVPSQVVLVQAIPLTPGGKLDRKALPEVDASIFQKMYVAPNTELEKQLAEIWKDVLGIERVGLSDNFFELGGDSLRLLKILSKVRAHPEINLDLKLRDLMAKPTIAELSGYNSEIGTPVIDPLLPLNKKVAELPLLFCPHAGYGTVFDYEQLAQQLDGLYSVYGIRCRMLLDPSREEQSLQSMAVDYVETIRRVQPTGPYHLLGWCLGGVLTALMANELERQGESVAFLGMVDSSIPSPSEQETPDDYRENLKSFIGHVFGLPEAQLPPAYMLDVVSPEEIEQLFRYIQKDLGRSTVYGEVEACEIADIYTVGMKLQRLSLQLEAIPVTTVEPYFWWANTTAKVDMDRLESAFSVSRASKRISASHYEILKNSELIKAVIACLVSVT